MGSCCFSVLAAIHGGIRHYLGQLPALSPAALNRRATRSIGMARQEDATL